MAKRWPVIWSFLSISCWFDDFRLGTETPARGWSKRPRYMSGTAALHSRCSVIGTRKHYSVTRSWDKLGKASLTLISAAPQGTEMYYYRTSNGTEVDLLLSLPGS